MQTTIEYEAQLHYDFFLILIKKYGMEEVLNSKKKINESYYWYPFNQYNRPYRGTEIFLNANQSEHFVLGQTVNEDPFCYTVFYDRPSPSDDWSVNRHFEIKVLPDQILYTQFTGQPPVPLDRESRIKIKLGHEKLQEVFSEIRDFVLTLPKK